LVGIGIWISAIITIQGVPEFLILAIPFTTQDELWLAKWQEAIDFLETYHRKPSKFIPEERNMRSWWKHNKKLMNAGELKEVRVEIFKQLLELGERYKHVNQYQ